MAGPFRLGTGSWRYFGELLCVVEGNTLGRKGFLVVMVVDPMYISTPFYNI
jgi:hypothetical protein